MKKVISILGLFLMIAVMTTAQEPKACCKKGATQGKACCAAKHAETSTEGHAKCSHGTASASSSDAKPACCAGKDGKSCPKEANGAKCCNGTHKEGQKCTGHAAEPAKSN